MHKNKSGLDTALSPLSFLRRSAEVFPNKEAIVDGDRRFTYADFLSQVQKLASALINSGSRKGDVVAYIATNSAELLFAHYSVPLIGAKLVAINTRLSKQEIKYICAHSESTLLFGDPNLMESLRDTELTTVRQRIELPNQDLTYFDVAGTRRYTDFLTQASQETVFNWELDDEDQEITINYTSGTTGKPKGVIYTHRGAYLNALAEMHHQNLRANSRYLWTLPMFHCNGWCNTWAVTAAAATHICLREVRGGKIWELIDTEHVSHLCGSPTVLATIYTAPEAHTLEKELVITTAGAPPTPTGIQKIQQLGARLIHVYGLTETYGPYSICELQEEWNKLPFEEQLAKASRQGVGMITAEKLRVVRSELNENNELVDVEANGNEMGELVMRGNNVMKGYLKDDEATEKAFNGGWFHSGDLGVMHSDGYVQILDRAKDIVISGGENISTIEVEQVIASHPTVLDVSVIGRADEKWGERPIAFVVVQGEVNQAELADHVRKKLASFKVPDEFIFVEELPKTSTGKVRKADLRALAMH